MKKVGFLPRLLFYVTPKKAKDRWRSRSNMPLASFFMAELDHRDSQRGKDELSLQAHYMTQHIGYPRTPWCNEMIAWEAKNQLVELQGKMVEMMSVDNCIRRENEYLQSVIDAQAREIALLKSMVVVPRRRWFFLKLSSPIFRTNRHGKDN